MPSILAFHGSNIVLGELRTGSWVVTDPEAAQHFAREKVHEAGGVPLVHAFVVDEDRVDWDAISLRAGVDDERGCLMVPVPVLAVLPEGPGFQAACQVIAAGAHAAGSTGLTCAKFIGLTETTSSLIEERRRFAGESEDEILCRVLSAPAKQPRRIKEPAP